jgi:hypothetical protein
MAAGRIEVVGYFIRPANATSDCICISFLRSASAKTKYKKKE